MRDGPPVHMKNAPRIEISLDDLLHNLACIRSRLPGDIEVLAVVKDNAYGCGSRVVAKTLEEKGGVGFFAVRTPSEAFFLKKNGVRSPVLVLGPASKADVRKGSGEGFVFTLNDMSDVDIWKSAGVRVRFHCNIDTRMNRMGILPSEVTALADALEVNGALELEGAFTHLANADEPAPGTAPGQIERFRGALTVREFPLDLRPVVSLKGRIVKIKKVPAGTPVSYGGRYVTERDTVIATIALGYGDGLPRSLGNRGEVLIRGGRYRIAGRVTMDYIMVDAGPDPSFRVGDEAAVMGSQGDERISPDDVALLDGTIAYEIMCGLSASIDRVYISGGKTVARLKGRIL
jgi:alanine racemase